MLWGSPSHMERLQDRVNTRSFRWFQLPSFKSSSWGPGKVVWDNLFSPCLVWILDSLKLWEIINNYCCFKPLNLRVTCSTGIDTNGEGILEPVQMYENHDTYVRIYDVFVSWFICWHLPWIRAPLRENPVPPSALLLLSRQPLSGAHDSPSEIESLVFYCCHQQHQWVIL